MSAPFPYPTVQSTAPGLMNDGRPVFSRRACRPKGPVSPIKSETVRAARLGYRMPTEWIFLPSAHNRKREVASTSKTLEASRQIRVAGPCRDVAVAAFPAEGVFGPAPYATCHSNEHRAFMRGAQASEGV